MIQKINCYDSIEDTMFHTLLNNVDDLIFFKDKDLRYLGCNQSFLDFVQQKKIEDVIGKNDFELLPVDIATTCSLTDKQMLKKNDTTISYEWVPGLNGKKTYHSTKKIPFKYNETDIGVLGISRDITNLYENEQKIKAQTYIDELTKLNNRKSYRKRLNELLSIKQRYNTTFSMVMYDIDDFKKVNDTYGHKIGDTVLIKMSEHIQTHLRENDYLFRIGGEEFIILFPETNLDDAIKVSSKICKAVEENLTHLTDKTITISMGVSEVNESDDLDRIFTRVDDLLYKSKNDGKNRISY